MKIIWVHRDKVCDAETLHRIGTHDAEVIDAMVPVVRLSEVETLKELKDHWEALANQYMDRIQEGERKYDTLIREAVKFAEATMSDVVTEGTVKQAQAFLARPDVAAWREREKQKAKQ